MIAAGQGSRAGWNVLLALYTQNTHTHLACPLLLLAGYVGMALFLVGHVCLEEDGWLTYS